MPTCRTDPMIDCPPTGLRSVRVGDVMSMGVVCVSPEATVPHAIGLMLVERVSGLPVVDQTGLLVGIVSERDFLRRAEFGDHPERRRWLEWLLHPDKATEARERAQGLTVAEVMTRQVRTTTEEASLAEAAAAMERYRVGRLPVMSAGRIVGIVTSSDVARALASKLTADCDDPESDETSMPDQCLGPDARV